MSLLELPSPELLLEPVVRVGLVVERVDLAVAGRAVEADRLREGLVGLEPDDGAPAAAARRSSSREQAATDPEAARRLRRPTCV